MAVLKKTDDTVQITNGDLAALKRIKEAYQLKDESDVISFAIGILNQSNGQGVVVRREDGTPIRLMPSDDIRHNA